MLCHGNGQQSLAVDTRDSTLVTPPVAHTVPKEQQSYPDHQKVPIEQFGPDSGLPAVSPNGAARKEERSQDNWTERSSYMSGDALSHGALRIDERISDGSNRFPDANQDALLLLFRMSVLVPIVSICVSIYTLAGLIFVLVVFPFRICSLSPCFQSTSLGAQLCDLLGPALHIHERLIRVRKRPRCRSSSAQWIYNDSDESLASESNKSYSVPGLILVLILSAFLCIPLVLAAWTAAFFWIFAMVLGNPEPDDTEREKDDGRAAVLGVSKWWAKWLSKARKPPR